MWYSWFEWYLISWASINKNLRKRTKISIRCNCTCTNFLLSCYHLRSPPIVQNWPYAFCDATFSPLSKVVMRVGYCCGDTLEAFAGHCASFRAAGGWVRGSVGYERHLANGTRNLSMGFLNIKLTTCSHVTKHSREYERPVYKKGCTYSIWIGRASNMLYTRHQLDVAIFRR